VYKHNTD